MIVLLAQEVIYLEFPFSSSLIAAKAVAISLGTFVVIFANLVRFSNYLRYWRMEFWNLSFFIFFPFF